MLQDNQGANVGDSIEDFYNELEQSKIPVTSNISKCECGGEGGYHLASCRFLQDKVKKFVEDLKPIVKRCKCGHSRSAHGGHVKSATGAAVSLEYDKKVCACCDCKEFEERREDGTRKASC